MCFRAFLQDQDDDDDDDVTAIATEGLASLTPEDGHCSSSAEDEMLSPVYPYPMVNNDKDNEVITDCPVLQTNEVKTFDGRIPVTNSKLNEFSDNSTEKYNEGVEGLTWQRNVVGTSNDDHHIPVASNNDESSTDHLEKSTGGVTIDAGSVSVSTAQHSTSSVFTFSTKDIKTGEESNDEISCRKDRDETKANGVGGTGLADNETLQNPVVVEANNMLIFKNPTMSSTDNLHNKGIGNDYIPNESNDNNKALQNTPSLDQIGINIAKLIEARNTNQQLRTGDDSTNVVVKEAKGKLIATNSVSFIQRSSDIVTAPKSDTLLNSLSCHSFDNYNDNNEAMSLSTTATNNLYQYSGSMDHGELVSSLHQAHNNNTSKSINNDSGVYGDDIHRHTPSLFSNEDTELPTTKDVLVEGSKQSFSEGKENSVVFTSLTAEETSANKHRKASFETIYISSSDGSTSSLSTPTNSTTPMVESSMMTKVTSTERYDNMVIKANILSPNFKCFLESLYADSSPPRVSSCPSNSVYDRFRDWSTVDDDGNHGNRDDSSHNNQHDNGFDKDDHSNDNHASQMSVTALYDENLDEELSEVFGDNTTTGKAANISEKPELSSQNIVGVKSLMESLFEATENVSTSASVLFRDEDEVFSNHCESSKLTMTPDAHKEFTKDEENRSGVDLTTSAEKEYFIKLLGSTIENEFHRSVSSPVENTVGCKEELSVGEHQRIFIHSDKSTVDEDNNNVENQSDALPEGCDLPVTPTKENCQSATTTMLKISDMGEKPLDANDENFNTTEYDGDQNQLSSDCSKVDDFTKNIDLDTRDFDKRRTLKCHDFVNRETSKNQDLNNRETPIVQEMDNQEPSMVDRLLLENSTTGLPYLDEAQVVQNIANKEQEDGIKAYLKQCDDINEYQSDESSQFETEYDDDSSWTQQKSVPITFVNDSMVQKLHLEKRHSQWRKKCYSLRHDFNPVYEDISTDDELTKLKKDRDDRFAYHPVYEYVTMDESDDMTDEANNNEKKKKKKDLKLRHQRKPLKSFTNSAEAVASPSGKLPREQPEPKVASLDAIQLYNKVRKHIKARKMEEKKGKENDEKEDGELEDGEIAEEDDVQLSTSPKRKSKSKKKLNKNQRKRLKKKKDHEKAARSSWSSMLKQPDQLFHEGGVGISSAKFKIPKIKLMKEIPVIDIGKLPVSNKKPSSTLKKVKKRSTAKSMESVNNVSLNVTNDDQSIAVEAPSSLVKTSDTENSSTTKNISSKATNDNHKSTVAAENSSISTESSTTLPLDNIYGKMVHPTTTMSQSSPFVAVSAAPIVASELGNEVSRHNETSTSLYHSESGDIEIADRKMIEPSQHKKPGISLASYVSQSPQAKIALQELTSPKRKVSFADFIAKKMNLSLEKDQSSKSQASTTVTREMNQPINKDHLLKIQGSTIITKETNLLSKKDQSLKNSITTTNNKNQDFANQPIKSTTTNSNKDDKVNEDEDMRDFVDEELERQIDERFGNFKRSTADMFSPTKRFDMSPCKTSDQRKQVLSETILKLRRLRNQQASQQAFQMQQKDLDVSSILKELSAPSPSPSSASSPRNEKSSPLYINTTSTIDLTSLTTATVTQSLDLLSPTSSVLSSASNDTETCLIETKSGCTMTVKKSYLKCPHRHEDGTKCITQCSRLPIPVSISDHPPPQQNLNQKQQQNQKERDAPSKAYFKFPHRHSDGTYCETVCSRVLAREKQRAIFNEQQAMLEIVAKPPQIATIPWKLIPLTIPKKSDLADPRLLPRTDDGDSEMSNTTTDQPRLDALDPRISPKEKIDPTLLPRTDSEMMSNGTDYDQVRFNTIVDPHISSKEKFSSMPEKPSGVILDGDEEISSTILDQQSVSSSLDPVILQEEKQMTNLSIITFPDQRESGFPTTSHDHENEAQHEQNMDLCDSETETIKPTDDDDKLVVRTSNKQGSVLFDSLDNRKKYPKKTRWDVCADNDGTDTLQDYQTRGMEQTGTPQHPSKDLMGNLDDPQTNPENSKDSQINEMGISKGDSLNSPGTHQVAQANKLSTPKPGITKKTETLQSHTESPNRTEAPQEDENNQTKKTFQGNHSTNQNNMEVSPQTMEVTSNQSPLSAVLSLPNTNEECDPTIYNPFDHSESQPNSMLHENQTIMKPNGDDSTKLSTVNSSFGEARSSPIINDIYNKDTLDIHHHPVNDDNTRDINTVCTTIQLKKESRPLVEDRDVKLEENSFVHRFSPISSSLSSSQSVVDRSNAESNSYTATPTTTDVQETIVSSSSLSQESIQHSNSDPNYTTTSTTTVDDHCLESSSKPVKKKMKMPALPFVFDATDTEEERNNWRRKNHYHQQQTSGEPQNPYSYHQHHHAATDQVNHRSESSSYRSFHSENYSHHRQQKQQMDTYYANNWFHNNYYAHGAYYSYSTYSSLNNPYALSWQNQYSHNASSYIFANQQQSALLIGYHDENRPQNGIHSESTAISSKENEIDQQQFCSPKEPVSHSSLGVSNGNSSSPSLPNVSTQNRELSSVRQTDSSEVDSMAKEPVSPIEGRPASSLSHKDLYSPMEPTSSNSTEGTPVSTPDDVKKLKPTFRSTMNPLQVLSSGDDDKPSPTTPTTTTAFPFPPSITSSSLNDNHNNTSDRWRHFQRQTSDPGAVASPLEWPHQQSTSPTFYSTNTHNDEPSSPNETTTSMWTVFQRLFSSPPPSSSNKSVGNNTLGDLTSPNDNRNEPYSSSSMPHAEMNVDSRSPLWPASSPTSLSSNPQILNLLNPLILQSLDDIIHEYFDEWLTSQEKTYLLEFSRGFILGLLDKRSVANETELLQIINIGIRDALASVQKRKQAEHQPSPPPLCSEDEASHPPWTNDEPFVQRNDGLSLQPLDRPIDPRKRRSTGLDLLEDPRLKRRRVSVVDSVENAFSLRHDVSTRHQQHEEGKQQRRRFLYGNKIQPDPDMYRNYDENAEGELQNDMELEEERHIPQQQRRVFSAKLPVQKRRKRNKKKKSRSHLDSPESLNQNCMQTIDIQVQLNNPRRRRSRDVVVRSDGMKKTSLTPTTNKVFPKDLTAAKLSLDDIAQLNRMNFQGGQQRQKRAFVKSPREKAEHDVTGWKLRQIRNSISTSPPTTSFFKFRKKVVQQNKEKKSNNNDELGSRLDNIQGKRVAQKKRSSFM